VFHVAVDEAQRVAELESRLIAGGAPLPALAVAVAACYTPFSGPLVSALLKRSWPEPLRELLDGISGEFAADRRHRKSIPSLTKIADHTSFAVAKQYEENPYPRWVGLPMLTPPMAVDEWFSRFMPFSPYRPIGKAAGLDLLIAGCGTGHHSILFAQSFPEPRTLAIDLSLASLCYAREKSRALGLDIEFAQADILELGGLERRFDIISSSGVLHHLGAPDRGWRTLLSLLRPDGCMHVGLYSELACRNTSMARDWLAKRGHRSSPDGIRRARQDLIAAAAQEPAFQDVLRYPDFYSTGECRDLLFHVQERRYTIPQIKSFLDEVGFQFLGFSIGPNVLSEFRRLNPGPSETDLDLWHQFETENPDTFKGMYQFWIQRRA
jgi:SAM-dependent methyltransferase